MLHKKRVLRRQRVPFRKKLIRIVWSTAAVLVLLLPIVYFMTHRQQGYMSPLPVLASNAHIRSVDDPSKASLIQALSKAQIAYSSIDGPQDGDMVVHLQDEGDAIFTSQKDLNEQISSLQLIMTRLTMEGQHFSRLDLRFDKPVITLK